MALFLCTKVEEGRGKMEEGRRKREEGRGKKEEGRRKREDMSTGMVLHKYLRRVLPDSRKSSTFA